MIGFVLTIFKLIILLSNNFMKLHPKESQATMTPEKALQYLQEGNQRFVQALSRDHDHLSTINITKDDQWPFAVILSCMDSRTSAELIFDQGLGDIFSIRIAGNVITPNILGSIEFACKIVGSKLIVILGHNKCGAIKGACDDVKLGNLTHLVNLIKPAVFAETSTKKNRNSHNSDFVEKVSHLHVRMSVYRLMDESPVLKDLIEHGDIGIIPAMYNIGTGEVDFFKNECIINPPSPRPDFLATF